MLIVPILRYYKPDLLTIVETNASNKVVAGVLSQQDLQSKLQHLIAYFLKTMQLAQLNYNIHDKEMLAIILAFEQQQAKLEGIQTNNPFLVYFDYRALEYFIITKKLLARQAYQAEYLSRFYFKLIYRARKSNKRANALSKKYKDVKEQGRVIEEYRTQVLLPCTKIDSAIVKDLQLALIETAPEQELELIANFTSQPYNSIQLLDKILIANRTSPDLAELYTKAEFEQEKTQQLKDSLLLRYGKLYVPDSMLIDEMPLRIAIIYKAHD